MAEQELGARAIGTAGAGEGGVPMSGDGIPAAANRSTPIGDLDTAGTEEPAVAAPESLEGELIQAFAPGDAVAVRAGVAAERRRASSARPRLRRLLTVPSGTRRIWAASL